MNAFVFASIKMAKTSAIAAKKEFLKNIDETISDPLMKKAILAKFDKRLESLNNVKPAHFQELRQLEAELGQIYKLYVEVH